MCQAIPGPRCYADSSKRLSSVEAKLDRTRKTLADCNERMDKAASEKKFSEYAKAKKRASDVQMQIDDLAHKALYIQRDVDGTKTGARMLKEAMAKATTSEELRTLQHRERAAAGLRFGREQALHRKHHVYASTGRSRPIYRIKGELELAA